MMTRDEAKLHYLKFIWGMASYYAEGAERGELSDNLISNVHDERLTESEAFQVQKEAVIESDRLLRRIRRLRVKINPANTRDT